MKRLRLQKNKRVVSRFFTKLTPILVLIIIFLLYTLFAKKLNLFAVSNIDVSGAKTFVSEADIKELAKIRSYGKNIFYLDAGEIGKSLLENFQGAKSIRVSKSFPDTIKIAVTERVPVAIVYNSKGDSQFLVDEDGYVLGILAPGTSNFPKILYESDIEVGYFLDAKSLAVYFDLLKALDSDGVSVSSASVQEDHLLVYLRNSVKVLVGTKRDVYEASRVLSQLLKQLSTQGKTAKVVDLRYDKVVVSYD